MVPEVKPQAPRNREDDLAVRDRLEDLGRRELSDERGSAKSVSVRTATRSEPCGQLAERDLPLLVARGAEAATLAREGEQELVPAVPAADPREAVIENAAA